MEAIAVAAGLSAAVVVALRKRLAWSGVRAAQVSCLPLPSCHDLPAQPSMEVHMNLHSHVRPQLASGLVIPRPKEFARKRNAVRGRPTCTVPLARQLSLGLAISCHS